MLSRIASFKDYRHKNESNCGHQTCISTLARIGYEFNAKSETVQCAACHFVVDNINDTLIVILELHQKYNNKCEFSQLNKVQSLTESFYLGLAAFATSGVNEKFPQESESIGKNNHLVVKVASPTLQKIIAGIEERLKKDISKENDDTDSGSGLIPLTTSSAHAGLTSYEIQQWAKHPGLANREERVRTFRGQDHRYSNSIYPDIIKQLVDAGFYFIGPTDNVRCFFCDGGLKNFSREDKPFEEHQKYFPECKYVKFLQGHIIKNQRVLMQDAVDSRQTTATTSLAQVHTNGLDFERPIKVLEAREVKARLELPLVQKLMELGYPKDHIRQAIERRFAQKGDDYESIADLVEDMLIIQGPGIIPSFKGALETVRAGNGASIPQPQSQIQVSAAAASASVPADRVDGTKRAALHSDANIPNLNPQDVVARLKNQHVEDQELRNLWTEYEQFTTIRTCQVCLENEITTVFLPCGHYVCCDTCTPRLTHCCICRSLIRGTVKALTSLNLR